MPDRCWRTSEEGGGLLGVCVRGGLGKGQDLNLVGRLWPASRKGWGPRQGVSILTAAGDVSCTQDKGNRSAWLLPLGGEDTGQAHQFGSGHLGLWAPDLEGGVRTFLLAALLPKQHGFALWSRISKQLRVCFLWSSNLSFTFLHQNVRSFPAGRGPASSFCTV